MLTVLNLLHQILLPKNENFTETETLTVMSSQAIVYSSMGSNLAYVNVPNLCYGTAKGKRNTTHTL